MRTVQDIAVVAAIKAYAHSLGSPIDYVPDLDILGTVKDMINAAPWRFPSDVDYGPDPGPTDFPNLYGRRSDDCP
jgi:hypothetical protein